MTIARRQIVHPSITQYYHCIARCVRRAYLCGNDHVSGKNFNHRKAWLQERMRYLASIFSIEICAYAVMSNHYHIVLYLNSEAAVQWSENEVIKRWCELFRNPLGIAYLGGESLSESQQDRLSSSARRWRTRLSDVSWYMRCLNEYIARQANKEDRCSGRFWEGRFRSQALLDEAALLGCMAYVDLNPVRAGMAEDLDTSDFTSIQERIRVYQELKSPRRPQQKSSLMAFQDECVGVVHATPSLTLPCTCLAYLQLVDWTGRVVRADKRGAIPDHVPPILKQLGLVEDRWVRQVKRYQTERRLKVRAVA